MSGGKPLTADIGAYAVTEIIAAKVREWAGFPDLTEIVAAIMGNSGVSGPKSWK